MEWLRKMDRCSGALLEKQKIRYNEKKNERFNGEIYMSWGHEKNRIKNDAKKVFRPEWNSATNVWLSADQKVFQITVTLVDISRCGADALLLLPLRSPPRCERMPFGGGEWGDHAECVIHVCSDEPRLCVFKNAIFSLGRASQANAIRSLLPFFHLLVFAY